MWPFSKGEKNRQSENESKFPLWDSQGDSPGDTNRDLFIEQNFESIMHEEFPDDESEVWKVKRIKHLSNYALIEAEPSSSEVGYESFIFLFYFDDLDQGSNVASYCLENGEYGLLATAPGCPKDIPREISF